MAASSKRKLKITLQSGESTITEAANYDAEETFKKVRAAKVDPNDNFVLIGEAIVDARNVKFVMPEE